MNLVQWSMLAGSLSSLLAVGACTNTGPDAPDAAKAAAEVHNEFDLDWTQLGLGCAVMGTGNAAHVMCNHGHSLNLRNENLYQRHLLLTDKGIAAPNEAQMMHGVAANGAKPAIQLPDPLTPMLRARLGERVRVRAVSYGPLFHTFHIHGHLWVDNGKRKDTRVLGPAEVYDAAEFYAGGGAVAPEPRAGAGDWMYHCHVEQHAVTGMWGMFRVLPKDGALLEVDAAALGKDGRFTGEVPTPLGGPGQTVDVWVVAAEVPLAVARVYTPATRALLTLERDARLFMPVADEKAFLAATAASQRKVMETQAETFQPWILSLRRGTKVRVHLRNVMPEAPASLHPHGVAYDIANDGTLESSVAQPAGPPVVSEWLADTAGTWPLHDHARQVENIGRGLFSAIVVKSPEEEKSLQRDYLVIFHDYDMDWFMGAAKPTGAGH
ncbi:MAG: hypothetical protein EXR79_06390 [Myxococcales bacterium]|nr:hypothetical protein [Myxococcales bacterium]